jgi:hypothetical protein
MALGLPVEGDKPDALRAGALARAVPTCPYGSRIGDLGGRLGDGAEICVVTSDNGVVLGVVRDDVLLLPAETLVADVMQSAPPTVRPSISAPELSESMSRDDRHRRVDRSWRRAHRSVRRKVLDAIAEDGSLPQEYGGTLVDASALLFVVFGLLRAGDPRARRLVHATARALESGPLLYRYPPDGADGFSPGESPFLPASWWVVSALSIVGDRTALARADAICGVLPRIQSEEFDLARGEALGNAPLVWAHAECARALFTLDRERRAQARARRAVERVVYGAAAAARAIVRGVEQRMARAANA